MPFSEDQGYYESTWMRERPGDQDYQIFSRKLDDRYVYSRFMSPGVASTKVAGGGAATGVASDSNTLLVDGVYFEYFIKGTQTILQPAKYATAGGGLNISMDLTNNDGVEITNGITDSTRVAFKVGTDGAFFFKCKVLITDVSGTDDFHVGYRKAEAYQAAADDYDEMATIGVSQGAAGRINIETILNNAATVTTNTTNTWADAATKTIGVFVSAAGVVTYTIDGAAPTTTAAYTFDDAEVVVPFVSLLHDTDVAETTVLLEWEAGKQ